VSRKHWFALFALLALCIVGYAITVLAITGDSKEASSFIKWAGGAYGTGLLLFLFFGDGHA
jgi:hypothetical protein